jgi:glycosyltransferase involved in cell wall biosynthesis
MKIAVLNITAGGMSGGYRKYLNNILPRFYAHPHISSLLVANPREVNLSNCQENLPLVHWLQLKPTLFIKKGINAGVEEKIREFDPDIVFIPTARYWSLDRIPTVIMVQNMEPMVQVKKNPLIEKIVNWGRYKEAYASAQRASRIISVSEFVKDFLINEWDIHPEKIGLVYHGTEKLNQTDFKKPAEIPDSWKGRFLFTAGAIRPARGLEDVFKAVKDLPKWNKTAGLVIAGNVIPRMAMYKKKLENWIRLNNLDDKICWTGNLSEKEMAWCYQNSSLFIMTSRVEACPNIALEAMSYGCICIVAENPPMPEIFEGAAIYYPPDKYEILSDKIRHVLNLTEDERARLRRCSLGRADHFNWDNCVYQTVIELKKAIEEFNKI